MKRRSIAITWIVTFLVAQTADFAVTYRYSPDLLREGNPLVWGLGLRWGGLILMHVVGSILICACTIRWWRRPVQHRLPTSVVDAWSFASYSRYGRVYSRPEFLARFLFQFPRPRVQLLNELGFVLPPLLSFGSALSCMYWWLLYGVRASWYVGVHNVAFPWVPYVLPMLVCYVLLMRAYTRIEWDTARERAAKCSDS